MNLKSYLPLYLVIAFLAALALSVGIVSFARKPSVKVIHLGTFSSYYDAASGRSWNQGERTAFQKLSSELKQHPSFTILRVKWGQANAGDRTHEHEVKYNRSIGTLDKMQYSVQQNPVLACQEVPESVIHLVASDKKVESGRNDWSYVVGRNGCNCENKVEIIH
jgi:hypothetical protein